MTEFPKRRAAIHEAGHVAMFVHLNLPLDHVEIMERSDGKWRGNTRGMTKPQATQDNIHLAMSGLTAEWLVCGYGPADWPTTEPLWHAADDWEKIVDGANQLVGDSGRTQYIHNEMDWTMATLAGYRDNIEAIAGELMNKGRLTSSDIYTLILGS